MLKYAACKNTMQTESCSYDTNRCTTEYGKRHMAC